MGIQVMDQQGRVNAILPLPPAKGSSSNVYFGGSQMNILYVTSGDKVFRRKLNTRGVHAFEAPLKPVKPKL
jgi:sugar lactone lactonase YvrE